MSRPYFLYGRVRVQGASLVRAVLAEGAPADRRETSRAAAAKATRAAPAASGSAAAVAFWSDAGPARWFAKDPAFDRAFRERFADLHAQAAQGALDGWSATAEGALALAVLLDQYPRNAFRGTPRMYATDGQARARARSALAAGHDARIAPDLRLFLYLPFAHSEDLADQDLSVQLCGSLPDPSGKHAERHRDIIRRFGRFPHRNAILGRAETAEERAFLDAGGYAG